MTAGGAGTAASEMPAGTDTAPISGTPGAPLLSVGSSAAADAEVARTGNVADCIQRYKQERLYCSPAGDVGDKHTWVIFGHIQYSPQKKEQPAGLVP